MERKLAIRTGVDIVYLPRFRRAVKNGGEKFLRRVYLESELTGINQNGNNRLRLAGVFAAKEAVIKALGLTVDSWHDIEISYQPNGAPEVKIYNLQFTIYNSSLSISHDGNYVIAQFVALIKKES